MRWVPEATARVRPIETAPAAIAIDSASEAVAIRFTTIADRRSLLRAWRSGCANPTHTTVSDDMFVRLRRITFDIVTICARDAGAVQARLRRSQWRTDGKFVILVNKELTAVGWTLFANSRTFQPPRAGGCGVIEESAMSRWWTFAAMPIAWIVLWSNAGAASEIDVMCPPPLRTTLTELAPLFEHASGHRLIVNYEPSKAIVDDIKSGHIPDIAILTAPNIDDLSGQGLLAARVDLVRSRLGIAVRSGAARPDVDTVEGFKRTLLASRSFARNEGADSGIYLAALLERLGIAASMKDKTTLVRSGYVAELVAKGEAEIGAQQVSELMSVAGVTVFPLPPEIQHDLVFSAGIAKTPKAPEAVKEFLKFMASPAAAAVMKARGLDPA
jgi:molybdate transport system substrate-binding protein